MLELKPCIDSCEAARSLHRDLEIPHERAVQLARSALEISIKGSVTLPDGKNAVFRDAVAATCAATRSIPPDSPLPPPPRGTFDKTHVQVANFTTLAAAKNLVDRGLRPLALNFANGTVPGGDFLYGATAQEESLCRASALYLTLKGDPMYHAHAGRNDDDSSDWAILSPEVPVFRDDSGKTAPEIWKLSILTCAAPVATSTADHHAAGLLEKRIHRVLSIARAYGYESLILGAWGCGAFGNDPRRTAAVFRKALETDFRGAFSEIVFAIADWSQERRILGPFRDTFSPLDQVPM